MAGVVDALKCVVRVSRPRGWLAYFWMSVIGFLGGVFQDAFSTCIFLYGMVSYLASIFAVNNLFDVLGDSLNPRKKNPLNEGCPVWSVWVVLLNQALFLVFLAYFGDLGVFAVYVAGLVLGLFYSAPPLRFKGKPGLDVLSHMLYFGAIPYLFGFFLAGGKLDFNSLVVLATFMAYSAFLQLRNLWEDSLYDEITGDRTLFVLFPKLSTALLVISGALSGVFATFVIGDVLVALISLAVSVIIGLWLRWERMVDSLVVLLMTAGVVL